VSMKIQSGCKCVMKTSQTKTNDKFCNCDFSIVSFLNVSIKGGC
jgi:hypothetical protein